MLRQAGHEESGDLEGILYMWVDEWRFYSFRPFTSRVMLPPSLILSHHVSPHFCH